MIDVQGSNVNILLGATSVVGEEIVSRGAACMRGFFVDTAREDALDRLAFDRYGMTRLPATPSHVDILFYRASAGTGGVISAGTVVQTASGTQFVTDIEKAFGSAALSVTIPATALEAGPDANIPANTPLRLVSSVFDTSIMVSNPSPGAGGADAEKDPAFRGRIRKFFPTIRRGVMGAIEYGAIQVPGIAVATAVEVLNPTNPGDGWVGGFPAAYVQLVVADQDGAATTTLIQQVRDQLIEFRAFGIPVSVSAGVVKQPYQQVRWNLGYTTSANETQVQNQVRAVSSAITQFLPPGRQNGVLFRSTLIAAAKTVVGAVITDQSLAYPLGDVYPDSLTQMIRVRPQDVSFE